VLGLAHGVARVIHVSRCVGHARCMEACPVGQLLADAAGHGWHARAHPGLALGSRLVGSGLVPHRRRLRGFAGRG
jgi:Fe-S-cluster-containing hydrogenase component 2